MRVVRNREATVRLHVDDESGVLMDAASLPTVAVTDGTGASVSVSVVTHVSQGLYSFILPPQPMLDVLTVTWTVPVVSASRTVVDKVKLVGDRLAPMWQMREDPELAPLSAANMMRLVEVVEEWFKRALHFPCTEEPLRGQWNFPGGKRLTVPNAPFVKSMIACTEGDTPLSSIDLADVLISDYAFEWHFAGGYDILLGAQVKNWVPGRKTLWITHGSYFDGGVVPQDLVRAAIILARYTARGSNYPERARQVATEGALITFATPTADYPTGLPDVDAAVMSYRIPHAL